MISCVCSPTAVTVSVLVSGVVSAISTAIVTSIIVWCVMRRPPSPAGTGTAADDKAVTELATVIYDTPHVIKEHNDQSAIRHSRTTSIQTTPLPNTLLCMRSKSSFFPQYNKDL